MSMRTVNAYSRETLEVATRFFQERGELEADVESKNDLLVYTLPLVECEQERIDSFIDALETTKACIQRVTIIFKETEEATISTNSITRLCSVVGKLSSLKELELCYYSPDDLFTPSKRRGIQYLTQILRHARNLETLKCNQVVFDGTTQDFQNFAGSLTNHPTLRELTFELCQIADGPSSASNFDLVVASWSTLQSLTLRLLCFSHYFPEVQYHMLEGLSLRGIAELRNLTALELNGTGMPAAGVILRQNQSITSLKVNTTLQEEELYELADIVRTNQVLKELRIIIEPFQDDHPLSLLLDDMKTNSSLSRLEFIFRQRDRFFSSATQNAIIAMLEKFNYTLLSLSFDLFREKRNHDTEKLVDYYLTLNLLGRGHLLRNPKAAKKEWVSVLTASLDNIDALFYFLSKNPTLCA